VFIFVEVFVAVRTPLVFGPAGLPPLRLTNSILLFLPLRNEGLAGLFWSDGQDLLADLRIRLLDELPEVAGFPAGQGGADALAGCWGECILGLQSNPGSPS
jgi:hypothetical protein